MSVAFLFPGQGSQQPGMLHDLPECAATAATLKEASLILKRDVLGLDSEVALRSTAAVQLALLISGVAFGRALLAEGAAPTMVGGLSVGAFAAAVIADALDFSLALPLVRLRGELMENMYPSGYGMAAIMGLAEQQIRDLIADVTSPDSPVFLGSLNAPRQIVVSGALPGLERLMEKARLAGASRTQQLNVSVPSHCRLLEPVAKELDRAAGDLSVRSPKCVYIGNLGGRPLRDSVSVRWDLVSNVAHAVRWHDATTLMFELGARLFVELPPGRALTNLAAASFPEARSMACAGSRIDFIAQLIRRYREGEEET
jgi:malonate decarboxylase epsilon subunit